MLYQVTVRDRPRYDTAKGGQIASGKQTFFEDCDEVHCTFDAIVIVRGQTRFEYRTVEIQQIVIDVTYGLQSEDRVATLQQT